MHEKIFKELCKEIHRENCKGENVGERVNSDRKKKSYNGKDRRRRRRGRGRLMLKKNFT